jgi:hypothetical protein
LGHFQNVAFFPLYPLIESLIIKISGSFNPLLLIFPGLLFGLWSNVAFNRLATILLPGRTAFWATVFFIFWPASCFLLMGYQTGLINLCAIACLHNYIEGRRFRASLWCGLGTAAAPTMVFIALALCSHISFKWLKARMPVNEIPKMILFGLLSVSGLILFMVYLQFEFHDAFAFMKAQSAWGKTPAFF